MPLPLFFFLKIAFAIQGRICYSFQNTGKEKKIKLVSPKMFQIGKKKFLKVCFTVALS